MLKQVPTIRTNFSSQEFIKGLVIGWNKTFNQIPKKEQIGVIYSQWSIETGQGKYCWNFNIGNVKAADDPNKTIEYCVLNNVWEIIKGQKVILSPDNPGSWFRSFPTLEDGIAKHLDFLKNHKYKSAWTAVESGNPAAFAHLLKLGYYYTAPEADYVKNMNYFFNKYMQTQTYEETVKELTKPTAGTTGTVGFIDTLKSMFK